MTEIWCEFMIVIFRASFPDSGTVVLFVLFYVSADALSSKFHEYELLYTLLLITPIFAQGRRRCPGASCLWCI